MGILIKGMKPRLRCKSNHQKILTMATIELAKQALSILNNHDFRYYLDDYAYTNGRRDEAKASMKRFVNVTNKIGGEMRELLRELWIATYRYKKAFQPGWTSDDAPEREATMKELKAKVEELLEAA